MDGQRKKPVVTVSTIHRGEDTAFVKRKNNVGVREEVQCPLSIAEYNKYMGELIILTNFKNVII